MKSAFLTVGIFASLCLASGQGSLGYPVDTILDGGAPLRLLHDSESGHRHKLHATPRREAAPPAARARRLTGQVCGDGTCGVGETATGCPADCTGLALQGVQSGLRGNHGVMFSLYSSTRPVAVTSLVFYTGRRAQDQQVQVYTREGNYDGAELVEDGWDLVYDRQIRLKGGRGITTVDLDDAATRATIAPGTFRSFFVWIPNNRIRYAVGTAEGGLAAQDDLLRLYEGVGITDKFSGDRASSVQSPRVFRGVVKYNVIAANQQGDPLSSSVEPVPRIFCLANQRKVRLQINTDDYGYETSYVFRKQGDTEAVFEGPGEDRNYKSLTLYTGIICVDIGMYELEMKDRFSDGLAGQGYYMIEVENEDGSWKAVRGTNFNSGSKVHVIDVGLTESMMTDRDRGYLVAHNIRRQEWHARYNKEYVPLRWSQGLMEKSKAYAQELLDTCETGPPEHAKGNPYGENIARNKGNGGWGQLYTPDKIVNRFVEREEGLPWARNGHLTNALWRATKYVGCAEASKTYQVQVGTNIVTKTCRSQVCRYAKPGNCNMGKYKDEEGVVDWEKPMLSDDSPCKPDCPPEGCYDE